MKTEFHLKKNIISTVLLITMYGPTAYSKNQCPTDKSYIIQHAFIQKHEPLIAKDLGQFNIDGGSDQNLKFLILKVSCLLELSPRPFLSKKLYKISTKYLDQFQRVFSQIPVEEQNLLLNEFKNIKRNENDKP